VGTHCHIAVGTKTHGIIGCYVHFDGYPSNMVPTLRSFLRERTPSCLMLLIRQAQQAGGIHSFNPEGVDMSDGMWGPEVFNDEDFGDGVHYRYLVDMETGELHAESRRNGSSQDTWIQITEDDWND